MNLRDALDVKVGSTPVNKIYKGTYKVWDRNKKALEGYCKQNTTEGKNKADTSSITETTFNGITFTPVYKNGLLQYIEANGTASNTSYIDIARQTYNAGKYILNGCPQNGSFYSYRQIMVNRATFDAIGIDEGNGIEVSLDEPMDCVIRLRIASGYTANSVKFYPMLRLASISDGTYEPYTNGASPNPDYPQEIEVMQGRQVVTVESKNLFDKDSEDVGYVYSSTGNYAVSILWNTSNWIEVDSSSQYVLSFKTTNTNNLFFSEFDENKTFIQRTTTSILTPTNNTKYIRLSYKNDIGTYDIQLEEGPTATPYVPYKNEQYTVDLKSKNELNYDLEPENKYYDMNGQPVTISGAVYVNQTINLLANTTYTFSYEEKIGDAIARLCEYKEDGTFIKRTLIQNNNVSIKLNSETSYVITSTNKAPTSMFIKPQLEEGSEATPYEPYYDYKLAGIGDYKDNFYTDKGKWYFKQNIGNVVLNGGNDEEYVYQNNARFWLKRNYWNNKTVPKNPINRIMGLYCNRFIERDRGDTWAGVEGISYDNPNTTLEPIGSSFDIACNSVATTAEAFKTWLSTHNLDIWYLLQNPQITEIPSTYTTLINQLNALYQAM